MTFEWDQEKLSTASHITRDYLSLSKSSSLRWNRRIRSGLLLFTLVLMGLVWLLCFDRFRIGSDLEDSVLSDWIIDHAGAGAPYHPAGIYLNPPIGCLPITIIQLQRHGSRYPTSHVTEKIKIALYKLKNSGKIIDETFKFIDDYRYELKMNDLLPLGFKESFKAGKDFKNRYHSILLTLDKNKKVLIKPFLRASDSQRVIDSASNFKDGLGVKVDPFLLISELPGVNNTLDDHNCPNAPEDEEDHANKWLNLFAGPIAKRLNEKVHKLDLTPIDIVSLMQLCYFESLATSKISKFCGVFERDEWVGYEYYIDLDKLYKHGHGNRLGPVQGVGYVAELLSRLTGNRSYVDQDQTQVNHTLDHSSKTFPLDRKVYLDFSHDNQIISIITAIGLKRVEPLLSAKGSPDPNREWKISKIVPFAARLVVEKLSCDQDRGEQVRVLINDAVVPMPFCGQRLDDGMCSLNDFVDSQRFSRDNGDGLYIECGYGSGSGSDDG